MTVNDSDLGVARPAVVTAGEWERARADLLRAEKGWTMPFASSRGTSFTDDLGVDGGFMLAVFLRDGDHVFLTYSTTQRGVDRLVFANVIQDLLPFGRKQDWEDSPEGWPQAPTYG